jgi:hypothetical protein
MLGSAEGVDGPVKPGLTARASQNPRRLVLDNK